MLDGPADPKKPEGGTLRDHLESVFRQTGHRDDRLDSVRPPEDAAYLLTVWSQIRRGVAETMAGLRVTWQDLKAYQDVNGIEFDAFEVDAIMAMEEALAEVVAGRVRGANGN